MARYRIDKVVVNTEMAKRSWDEATDWNGSNHISRAIGSQWEHETLYQSSQGNFYIVHTSQWQGSLPRAWFVGPDEAALWLQQMDEELPEELTNYSAEE